MTETLEVKPPSPSTLRRRHLAFKAHAAEVLLKAASERNPCSMFEDGMIKVGLNAIRPQNEHMRKRVKVVGETTTERFEHWRKRTGRYLRMLGAEHGYNRAEHLKILEEAGFSTESPMTVGVKITVTLEVPSRLSLYPSESPEEMHDRFNEAQIREMLYEHYRRHPGGVTWKVERR